MNLGRLSPLGSKFGIYKIKKPYSIFYKAFFIETDRQALFRQPAVYLCFYKRE
jgi:hypothetical protein